MPPFESVNRIIKEADHVYGIGCESGFKLGDVLRDILVI